MARALDVKSFRTKPDGAPMTTADRVRLVRALAGATAYAVENACAGGAPPPDETGARTLGSLVRGDRFPTRADCYAASAIGRTWMLFADPGLHMIYPAVTRDGEPPVLTPKASSQKSGETGFPPLLAAALIVVAIAAYAGAICYVAQAAAEVIDRKLTNDAVTARLVETQARALGMVDDHTERQRAARRPIPWDPAELKVLDALVDTQKQIAGRTGQPLPNPFEGAVEGARDAGKKLASVGLDMGLFAIVLGGAYFLTR